MPLQGFFMPGGKKFLSAPEKIAVSGENYRFFTVWDKNLLEIGGKISYDRYKAEGMYLRGGRLYLSD